MINIFRVLLTKEENIAICRRYIVDILCIDTIFHGEISVRRNFGRNPKKSAISRNISAISRDISAIFPDISHGQRGSTEVKRATVKSMRYSA